MTTHEQQARKYFTDGYNCAQSVFLAYAKEYGFDKDTALKLSSSFGGGMGRLREVCGAVSAMFMIAGLKYGYTQNNNDEIKAKHYKFIQTLAHEFQNQNGSIICKELLDLMEKIIQFHQNEPNNIIRKDRVKNLLQMHAKFWTNIFAIKIKIKHFKMFNLYF